MKILKSTVPALLIVLGGLVWQSIAAAQTARPETAPAAGTGSAQAAGTGDQYSEKGADTCLECHDAEADTATFTTAGIFRNRHASRVDGRSPFGPGGLQCEACHGPGARHSAKGSKKTLTTNSHKKTSFMPPESRNEACLGCHSGGLRNGWHAGAHDGNRLACTDCHQLHVEIDPVLARKTQAEVCFTCHKQQRADFQKTSSHPVRFGQMACGDCHNTHGSTNVAMLVKPTVNQTCFSCHAEKRGPVLWEHAPVAEDCGLCHSSHGSVRTALLNKTPPLLCQQCHSAAAHPSVARTGAALPGNGGAGAAIFLVAGSCTNCHSQVHGSNHPAGAKLMR
jgi:DmsE family decaheme c-type cytochrome